MILWRFIGAVLLGLALGYVMQRPQICYNRAYRTGTLQRDTTMLKALALAMLIQMVAFQALVAAGVVKLNIVPGIWLAALLGGFVFGVAFVFARGCSTSMWYRIGNGNVGSFLTLIGFAAGEVLTFDGPLSSLRESLTAYEVRPASGQPATLPNLLGISPWLFVIPLTLIGCWWLWRSAQQEKPLAKMGGWTWPVSGLLLGLIGTAAWVISQDTGWDYGIGVVGATGPIVRSLWQGPGALSWGSYLVLAMPIGGFIAARQRGEFLLKIPDLSSGALSLISGLVMGISAAVAGGCNIGHTFTGAPTLALSSLLASLTIFLGAVVGNWLKFAQLKQTVPALEVER